MDDSKSQNIKQYVQDFESIIDIVKVCLDKFEEFGFSGAQPLLAEKIAENIKSWKQQTPLLIPLYSKAEGGVDFENTVKTIFELYSIAKRELNSLTETVDIFMLNRPTPKHIGSTSSGSTITKEYIEDTLALVDKLSLLVNKIKYQFDELDIGLFARKALDNITIDKNTIMFINSVYTDGISTGRNPETTDLYCEILSHILSRPGLKSEVSDLIKIQVEKFKTLALTVKTWSDSNRMNNTIQLLMQKYRLVPDCDSIPLEDLVAKYFKVTAKPKSGDVNKVLSNIYKINGIGFLVFDFSQCGKLEHLIPGKVGAGKEGVDLEFIKKTQTIRVFNAAIAVVAPGAAVIRIPEKEIPHDYYILDTLDGINFRLLRMWESGPILYIPSSRVEAMGNTKMTPSSRLSNYNYILDQELVGHVVKPLYSEIEKFKPNYWQIIRERIIQRISGFFKDEIGKKPSAVMEILKSDKTVDQLISIILELVIEDLSVSKSLQDTENGSRRNHIIAEITISCFGDLEKVRKKFKNGLDELTKHEQEIKTILAKETGSSLVNNLILQINKSLEVILKTFIDTNTGIFINIMNKLNILEAGLANQNI